MKNQSRARSASKCGTCLPAFWLILGPGGPFAFLSLVCNVGTIAFQFAGCNLFSRNPSMRFTFPALSIGLILAAQARAGDDGLAGYWKFSVYDQGQQNSLWLVHLDKDKNNKLTVSFDPFKGAPRAKLEEVKQDGDTIKIKFTGTVAGQGGSQQISFDYE